MSDVKEKFEQAIELQKQINNLLITISEEDMYELYKADLKFCLKVSRLWPNLSRHLKFPKE